MKKQIVNIAPKKSNKIVGTQLLSKQNKFGSDLPKNMKEDAKVMSFNGFNEVATLMLPLLFFHGTRINVLNGLFRHFATPKALFRNRQDAQYFRY